MKITLLLTPEALGAARMGQVLSARRGALARSGVLVPKTAGERSHSRLFMAVTDPDHVDPLRAARGLASPGAQARLTENLHRDLGAEIASATPDHLLLALPQAVPSLARPAELRRLRDFLAGFSTDIRLVCHVEDQARVLARHHFDQVLGGRSSGLQAELALSQEDDWRAGALAQWQPPQPERNAFAEIDAPPFWLDWQALAAEWEQVFGPGTMRLRPANAAAFAGPRAARLLLDDMGLDLPAGGPVDPVQPPRLPSAAWAARAREVNALLVRILGTGRQIPRHLWRRMLSELVVPGPPLRPGSLAPVSRHFAAANAALARRQPELAAALTPDQPLPDWQPEDPGPGFRASQYAAAFLPRIDAATRQIGEDERRKAAAPPISAAAADLMSPRARELYDQLAGTRYAPRNDLPSAAPPADSAAPYAPAAPVPPGPGRSGAVIVACMKNEAPYIVEWIAYHRAIGINDFLIYTNGCEDGTDEILDRLAEMGVLTHRLNDDWQGNSPQQCGAGQGAGRAAGADGRLAGPYRRGRVHQHPDRQRHPGRPAGRHRRGHQHRHDLAAVRPFRRHRFPGPAGDRAVHPLRPGLVPKPHTAWGFKTLFRNIGAYEKLSCHRPNKVVEERRDRIRWVNGSGRPMGPGLVDRGWRSATDDIGYDLVQLNHYALRSADSFLVKRQRGRALHVDRSIGLNYWIRMDWSDAEDLSIQRNLRRLRAEMDRLLADPALRAAHEAGVAWHRDKAKSLRQVPEFVELYGQALNTRLTGMERVAYALALNVES